MTERRTTSNDPFAAFVVETRVKTDGRKIHYYEWPERPPEPGDSKPDKDTRKERSRV